MRIIFFGTPQYVVPILEALHKEYNRGRERQFFAVVTQPPKPVGREKKVQHSPVDNWAFKHKMQIFTDFKNLPEADLGIVASFGKIIPQDVIDKFQFGLLNIHPSSLPEFRGTSPVQATILTGKEMAIVSIIKMDELMDHGPVVSSFKENISHSDTTGTLRERLFARSAEFLVELIPSYISGKIKPIEQDHENATFTKLINKQDGFIKPEIIAALLNGSIVDEGWNIRWITDYQLPVTSYGIANFIRAMNPWPMAWTHITTNPEVDNQRRIKLISSHIEEEKLVLDKVQLEGKNEISWEEFKKGYPNFIFR